MTSTTFDTLAFAKRMKKAGFTDIQAEEQAEALAELFKEQLASKQDIKNLDNSLRLEIKSLENTLTLRFGSMLALAVVAVPFILKLVHLV